MDTPLLALTRRRHRARGPAPVIAADTDNEVLAETGFNISETARQLGMHRRTLARKLDKRQVR